MTFSSMLCCGKGLDRKESGKKKQGTWRIFSLKDDMNLMGHDMNLMGQELRDVYSFGILLLELVSGKKPIEKLDVSTERMITDWALPLACEGKFRELADPRLNGDINEEELKIVVLVALVCAQSQPERRPKMLEVLQLLKGEANEKLAELENDEIFKSHWTTEFNGHDSVADSADFLSEEKDVKD